MANLKCLAVLGLLVVSLAVSESRVARQDLGLDLGGLGVGLGVGLGIGLGGGGSGSGAGAGSGSGSRSGSSSSSAPPLHQALVLDRAAVRVPVRLLVHPLVLGLGRAEVLVPARLPVHLLVLGLGPGQKMGMVNK
ncbi:HYPHALLY REGULATED CELL WALL PROTEIN 1 [Salix viminalis]|uniref:HYPHALLY REGULATED CELL WALL PROTEIN 1 n=1 Tax=Salix viminalis TaxID=40686 RepID=A0A9Q0NPC0_SALVM|nr:HYPHALLY REGULATED CELL WALL PROTEIN 1 [Salix viminalis]